MLKLRMVENPASEAICGQCGGWYGSKVWHSTDKYCRVIWQCNAKSKEKKPCQRW
ncbi:MAG: hypothetical protein IJJ23_02285 [Clostridia bacterium]|nr:hypothetical protein [Clostridia bacterium]